MNLLLSLALAAGVGAWAGEDGADPGGGAGWADAMPATPAARASDNKSFILGAGIMATEA